MHSPSRQTSARAWLTTALVFATGLPTGCGDSDVSGGGAGEADAASDVRADTDSGGADTSPVTLDPTAFTYRLTESTSALTLWTTPPTHKVLRHERAPEAEASGLALTAARGEFEPVQLILGPAGGGPIRASVAPFADLGSQPRIDLAEASYEGEWAEHLTPLPIGSGLVSLDASAGVPLWLTVYVPRDAPAGAHETTLTLTPSEGAALEVPVRLTVFDFELPAEIHFGSQLNLSVEALIPAGGSALGAHTLLWEHRLTPASPTWPSGFHWSITWENSRSSDPCGVLWDEPDEPDEYAIGSLARRYLLGEGWNGVGYPDAEIFQFVDNSTPRPASFCGLQRGDHDGTAAYNAEWGQFLGALTDYLSERDLLERTYYYVQNEPQGAEDYALAAHLCRLVRQAAPGLRIAVSEEPKPEIAEHAEGGCGYDLWIAHVRAYAEDYALARQRDFGEQVWLYSLDQDPDPYFNPTRVDRQGVHERIIPWVSWRYRATGWAYYDGGRFFDGPRPSIRAELLREGFEDYEYLWLANGGAHPRPLEESPVDATVASVASSLTSFTQNADALMALRYELGRYLEGSRPDLPVLEVESAARPRGAYYLNFQHPAGQPTAEPLVVDGHTWLKVGWGAYDAETAIGWSGEHIDDSDIALYGYDAVEGYNELARSYLYDDYGRANLFELGLENGRYRVTAGVGRPARGYPNDPHNLTIEGVRVVDDEPTSDAEPTLVRTVEIELRDGSLSLEMGGRSQRTGDFAYTFVGFVAIEPSE